MKIKCKRCKYEWDYNGKSEWYCSCPRCKTQISIRKLKNEGTKNV
jgi:hypothetical protein